MSLKIGALFAGMGGLDIAVESVLDSRVSWVAEFDDGPSRILAHRYPHAPNLGDITTINWQAVDPVDVCAAGSPARTCPPSASAPASHRAPGRACGRTWQPRSRRYGPGSW